MSQELHNTQEFSLASAREEEMRSILLVVYDALK